MTEQILAKNFVNENWQNFLAKELSLQEIINSKLDLEPERVKFDIDIAKRFAKYLCEPQKAIFCTEKDPRRPECQLKTFNLQYFIEGLNRIKQGNFFTFC